jgi:Uri superfamily endonuclease
MQVTPFLCPPIGGKKNKTGVAGFGEGDEYVCKSKLFRVSAKNDKTTVGNSCKNPIWHGP